LGTPNKRTAEESWKQLCGVAIQKGVTPSCQGSDDLRKKKTNMVTQKGGRKGTKKGYRQVWGEMRRPMIIKSLCKGGKEGSERKNQDTKGSRTLHRSQKRAGRSLREKTKRQAQRSIGMTFGEGEGKGF